MKPAEFRCSDALRDALRATVTELPAFVEAQKLWKNEDHGEGITRWHKEKEEGWMREAQAAIEQRFWLQRDRLPQDIQNEVQQLDVQLQAMVSGSMPVLRLGNLPKNLPGLLVGTALMRHATQPAAGKSLVEQHSYSARNAYSRAKSLPMHRDGWKPAIFGLMGYSEGGVPIPTVFISLDEFIDEVARHYRSHRGQGFFADAIEPALREEVIALMSEHKFQLRSKDPISPLLAKDQGGWRFHPQALGYTCDVRCIDGYTDPRLEALTNAVNAARTSLKAKEGHIIRPGDLVMWNNDCVIHSMGNPQGPEPSAKSPARVLAQLTMLTQGAATAAKGFQSITAANDNRLTAVC